MREMIAVNQNVVSPLGASDTGHVDPRHQVSQRRWTLLLVASAVTTVILAVLGLTLGTVSLLHLMPLGHPLATIGVVLLALTFPGLIFTAHCLDRIDDAMHAIKMADYQQKLIDITDPDDMK